jgi:hypothetical protein
VRRITIDNLVDLMRQCSEARPIIAEDRIPAPISSYLSGVSISPHYAKIAGVM